MAFVFSPLVGTPLTTSAKFAVVAKSPLTGLVTDALGVEPVRHLGQAAPATMPSSSAAAPHELSVLLIAHDGVRLVPAPELAGMAAAEAEEAVQADARARVAHSGHRTRR